jgi:hypothetical protein
VNANHREGGGELGVHLPAGGATDELAGRKEGTPAKKITAPERHYALCQNPDCKRIYCIDRRDSRSLTYDERFLLRILLDDILAKIPGESVPAQLAVYFRLTLTDVFNLKILRRKL